MLSNNFTRVSDYGSSNSIKRRAINAFGHMGSLYDCFRDHVLIDDTNKYNVPRQSIKPSEPVKCLIICGNSDASRNLLRTIHIENDLRLSLLLNLTPAIGIATVLNHSDAINERTRFLYYSWIAREERIPTEVLRTMKLNVSSKSKLHATHVVTGINYGIDLAVVLQLSSDTGSINEIDHILQKTSRSLCNGDDVLSLFTNEENDLLKKINNIRIYSNIADLTGLNNMFKLVQKIQVLKRNLNVCQPITYSLQSLAGMRTQTTMREDVNVRELPTDLHHSLEQFLLQRRSTIKILTKFFQKNLQNVLKGYLSKKLTDANIQYLNIKQKYQRDLEQLSKLLVDFRHDQIDVSIINNNLIEKNRNISSHELIRTAYDLEEKVHLIIDLLKQNFNYCNVIDHNINNHDNENTIRTKLVNNTQNYRILCSNDILNRNNRGKLNHITSCLNQEHQQDSSLSLVYADFSYCLYTLHNMYVLSSTKKEPSRNQPIENVRPSSLKPAPITSMHREEHPSMNETRQPIRPSTTDDTINILLLGESGVGKSTFINAFVNYLTFNSLEQAQSNKPLVIVPVSFTMTIGDQFEERKVKFGNVNDSYGEDFSHPGQSVTQRCKSYVFTLKRHDMNKTMRIRIIDTPGFGDTRGPDQDDRNMEHILQYINNLTHLNAICFLLKPNASKLNIFFRTCLTQLLSLLSPTVRKNIIFCFTNARSTFYAPGNTAPLLKTMLAESSIGDVSFEKQNTFCFDSEAFRYLVALQNQVDFTREERKEYENSWSISVKEVTRLIDYISNNRTISSLRNGWQSIKRAQLEISHMIRPILETIRNLLRNMILIKMNQSQMSIELNPKPVLCSTGLCSSCRCSIVNHSQFWIVVDVPHEVKDKCYTCSCACIRHISIDYILEYRSLNRPSNRLMNEMNDMLHQLYFASAQFSHFLIHGARSTREDLFLLGFKRMIITEKDICAEKQSNKMNLQLITELEKAQYEYEKRIHEITSNQSTKTLANIYEQIKTIRNYREINEQILVIERGQQAIMKENEIII